DQVRAESLQPLCGLLQQSVTDIKSVACVYVLKSRHVDLDYDRQLRRARRQRVKPLDEDITVQAASELIVVLGAIDSLGREIQVGHISDEAHQVSHVAWSGEREKSDGIPEEAAVLAIISQGDGDRLKFADRLPHPGD